MAPPVDEPPARDRQLSTDLASLRITREERFERPPRRWPYVLAGLVVLGAGAAVWARERGTLASKPVEVAQVTLVSPSQADVQLVATGYVVSRKKATLSSRLPGRLLHLYVDEGDRVKAGQLVAEIDRSDAEAGLAAARADLSLARTKVDEARAQVADAEAKARREQALASRGAGAAATLEDAETRVRLARAEERSAQANVEALAARIRTAEVALDYTKVRAPFDGTVLRKLGEEGEMMNPNAVGGASGGVVTIASLAALEVEADVSETQLAKVVPPAAGEPPNTTPLSGLRRRERAADDGAESHVDPASLSGRAAGAPAEIVLDAYPDRRFRGQVSEVRPTVDRAKATVTVKVRFVDPTDGVLPDMSAKVSFLSRPIAEGALAQAPKRVIPEDAVTERDGRRVVFAVEGGRAHAVPVVVRGPFGSAASDRKRVEIADGPPPGTSIVRAPAADLVDGAKLKLPE